MNIGAVAIKQGDGGAAATYLEASLTAARPLPEMETLLALPPDLAVLAINRKDYGRAQLLLAIALTAAQQLGAPRLAMLCLEQYARLADAQGHRVRASRLAVAAESLRTRMLRRLT